MLQCGYCSFTTDTQQKLGIHKRKAHNLAEHVCTSCKRNFNSTSALSFHKKKPCDPVAITHANPGISVSGNESSATVPSSDNELSKSPFETLCPTDPSKSSIYCGLCNDEDQCFLDMPALCNHLQEKHGLDATIQHSTFESLDAFEQWKKDAEINGKFEFTCSSSRVNKDGSNVSYYQCHRSGKYQSEAQGKRAPKKLGSIKTGFSCSAFAIVRIGSSNQNVTVTHCLNHYVHDKKVARLHLRPDIKSRIAHYVREKRNIDWILDTIRTEFDDQEPTDVVQHYHNIMSRQNCITRGDIRNVIASLGLTPHQLDGNDYISTDLMIKQHEQNPESPFFYYKPQDESGVFTLGIQTSFQKSMLMEAGNKVICCDATHSTQRYQFLLITVMVIDTYGKGYPCAWLITTNETEDILAGFFKEMRERCGDIRPEYFMSDAAPQYWTAWNDAFGPNDVTKKLLCTWHVQRSWQKNVMEKLIDNSTEQRVVVWRCLNVLLKEHDQARFQSSLTKFLTLLLESGETAFYDYFKNTYCGPGKIDQWAYWARIHAPINVNMYLEGFHSILKSKYLNRQQNRRLDSLIGILLKIAKDYLLEYCVAYERGGSNSYRLAEMHRRHRAFMNSADLKIETVNSSTFNVQSASDPNIQYAVHYIKNCTCGLRCGYCKVCPHMYECTCPDATFTAVACKHVHCVHSSNGPVPTSDDSTMFTEADDSTPPATQIQALQTVTQERPLVASADDLRQRIKIVLANVAASVDEIDSAHDLSEILKKQTIVERFANSCCTGTVPSTQPKRGRFPHNLQMTKQNRSFRRLKSHRKTERHNFTSLQGQEVNEIQALFDQATAQICGICYLKDDYTTNDYTDWIDCDKCGTWFHSACILQTAASASYICDACRTVL